MLPRDEDLSFEHNSVNKLKMSWYYFLIFREFSFLRDAVELILSPFTNMAFRKGGSFGKFFNHEECNCIKLSCNDLKLFSISCVLGNFFFYSYVVGTISPRKCVQGIYSDTFLT